MSINASEMPFLIVKSPRVVEVVQNTLLPPFLQVGKKSTFNHDDQ